MIANNPFNFNGRIDRTHFFFVNLFILLTALVVDKIQLSGLADTIFLMIVSFGILWLYLASLVKRLRDAGINLWWTLLVFVPLANWLLFLTALLKSKSHSGELQNDK